MFVACRFYNNSLVMDRVQFLLGLAAFMIQTREYRQTLEDFIMIFSQQDGIMISLWSCLYKIELE